MKGLIYLALRYVCYHRWRSVILMLCLSLTFFFPLSVHRVVIEFQSALWARSEATPMVIGAKGSRFDLVLHALYFRNKGPDSISWADYETLRGTGLGDPIPIHSAFQARGFPIVGTSLDYLEWRGMELASGRSLLHLGECVLGASVAAQLELVVGDSLMSDPENVFNIAGDYPLKMRVVGILSRQDSPDDQAVFVDIKTAWVIAGIGHGHDEVADDADSKTLLRREGNNRVVNASVLSYMEVTEANRDSFHFHASPGERPLTALLFVPRDAKSGTLLRGRFQGVDSPVQILRPREVVNELMTTVSRVKQFLDLNFVLVLGVVGLFLGLVILLSLRLREREMETLFLLGCRRGTVWGLLFLELSVVGLVSLGITLCFSWVAESVFETWLRQMFS